MAAKLPREVALTRVTATRTSVAVSGGLTGTLTEGAWRDWTAAVTVAGTTWRFPERPPLPTGAFHLTATARR
jgi:hypothetical protein